MVKPQQLWALFKKCPDDKWLGAICRSLGGQDVPYLDFGQKQMVETLLLDNEWHTESIEAIKTKERTKKQEYREKIKREEEEKRLLENSECPQMSQGQKGTDHVPECPRDKKGQIVSPTIPSSVPSFVPSFVPSSNNSVCVDERAVARTHTHTNEGDFVFDVAAMSAKLEIPQAYIEERLKEWDAVGWTTAKGVQITKKTVRAQLKAFWKCEKNQAAYLKTPKRARTFTFEDWALCRECCANAKAGGGCSCGVAVPPDKNEERKFPPNECRKFKAKEPSA